jgi:cell division protein FtsQ
MGRRLALGVALLALLGAVVGKAYWLPDGSLSLGWLRTFSSRVEIYGNRYVPSQEIFQTLGAGDEPDLSPSESRRRIERIPWVGEATVARLIPHGMGIWIHEREPVAFVRVGGVIKLVDAEGILLDIPTGSSFDFPVLTGWIESGTDSAWRRRLKRYEEFNREISEVGHGDWIVSEVDLSDLNDLKALLIQRTQGVLAHFGRRDFGKRFRNFQSFMSMALRRQEVIRAVDMRFRDQVVVLPEI